MDVLKTHCLLTSVSLAAFAVGLNLFTLPAYAVTSQGQIDAVIISGLTPTLSPIEELNFGEIVATGSGNVTISTAGAPILDPGLSLTGSSPHQQGVMRVLGTPGAVVDINIVPGAYFVDNGLGVTMPVTAFDIGNGANNNHAVTIGGGASVDVNIGATLAVGAGQQAGSYTGAFTLNADYQ